MKFIRLHLKDQGAQVNDDVLTTIKPDAYDIERFGDVGLKVTPKNRRHDTPSTATGVVIPWGHIRCAEFIEDAPAVALAKHGGK